MATIEKTTVTQTTIGVTLSGLDKNFKGTRTSEWYISGRGFPGYSLTNKDWTSSTGSGGGVTFTGLTASTTYTISCLITWTQETGGTGKINPTNNNLQVTTLDDPNPPPSLWYWPSSMQSGNAVTNLTATTWNSFTAWVNKVQKYNKVTETSFDTVYKGNQISAYYDIKPVIDAIRAMGGSSIATPSAGDDVTMALFNRMSNALNNLI